MEVFTTKANLRPARRLIEILREKLKEIATKKPRSLFVDRRGYALARDRDWVKRMLEETRRRGYATRDPADGGDFDKPKREYNDGNTGIAVPILVGERVVASINLMWRERLATTEQIARRNLKDLKAAAELIARRLTNGAAR